MLATIFGFTIMIFGWWFDSYGPIHITGIVLCLLGIITDILTWK